MRFGSSFLLVQDWARLLGELLRVTRSDGIVRVTDAEAWESASPACNRINQMFLSALYRSGHLSSGYTGMTQVLDRLLSEGGYDGEVVKLSGRSALNFYDAAAILRSVSGRPVEYTPEDRDGHVERLRSEGTPETYITWRMAMLDAIADGRDSYISDGTRLVLGRDAGSFQEWAEAEVIGHSSLSGR